MKTLSIIGGGAVGKTLGYLWHHSSDKPVVIQQVLNKNITRAQQAVQFIGQGKAISQLDQLKSADIFMLTVPDDQIAIIAANLAQLKLSKSAALIFHCSGSLSSESTLQKCQQQGSLIASVHPLSSFADPSLAIHRFKDTACAIEGDPQAIHYLYSLFVSIAGNPFFIHSKKKIFYHIGSVLVCGCLVSLIAQLHFAVQLNDSQITTIDPLCALAEQLLTILSDYPNLLIESSPASRQITRCEALTNNQLAFLTLDPYFRTYKQFALKNKEEIKHIAQISKSKHPLATQFVDYFLTLLDMSLKCYAEAGITPVEAMSLLAPLINSTLNNLHHKGIKLALTGPMTRGDITTIQHHYAALVNFDQNIYLAYRLFNQHMLDLITNP